MNSSDEIRREREAAARGQMPFVHNKINMRTPPEERLPGVIRTETNKESNNE
jgi:hypothetical protein